MENFLKELSFFFDLLLNGLLTGMLYSLIALGLVFIYKASGVLNFAQGAMVLLSGFLVALLINWGVPIWAAVALGAAVMIGMSFVVERMVLRPLVAQPIISLIMATLGLTIFIEGLQTFTSNIWPVYTLNIGIPRAPIMLGDIFISPVNVVGAVIALLLFAGAGYFFMYTRTGMALRAVSDDHEAALSVGVSIKRLWVIVWGVAGVAAMLAGLIWGSRLSVQASIALLAFKAFPVVIMGGLESIVGALVAGLLVGAAENLAAGYLDPYIGGGTKDFFPYFIMLIVLWVRPYGLFGREIIERV
ncbi:MAG: branched-chain amino acid ABC transporter permease [Chloroflexota bacterium]